MELSNHDQQLQHIHNKMNEMNYLQVVRCIEMRPSISLLLKDYLLSDKMRRVHNEIICPFYGGQASIKSSALDRIKTVVAEANIPDINTGMPIAGVRGGVNLQPGPKTNPTYQCVGCNQEYIQANININLIIKHLHGSSNIAKLVKQVI